MMALAFAWLLVGQDFQEIATLRGHAGKALCASFSGDGRFLVTGGEDRTIKIWEVATGRLIRAISGHRGFVNCAALSADGRVVAASVGEKSVRLYNVETGEQITMFQDVSVVEQLAFSRDGSNLIALGGGRLSRRDPRDASRSAPIGGSDWVGAVRFQMTADEKFVALVSAAGTVQLCDVEAGTVVKQVSGLEKPRAIALTPGKTHLIYPSGRDIVLVNLKTDKESRIRKAHEGDILWLLATPDGKSLISAGSERTLKMWDLSTYAFKKAFKGQNGDVLWLDVSPDSRLLAVAASDGFVRLWNTEKGDLERSIEAHETATFGVSISPDGSTVLSVGADRMAHLWDLKESKRLRSFPTSREPVLSEWAAGSFRGEGKFFALSYEEKGKTGEVCRLKVWSAGGAEDHSFSLLNDAKKEDAATVLSVKVAPDGSFIAVLGKFGSATTPPSAALRIYSYDGKLLRELNDPAIEAVAIHPDSKRVAVLGASLKTVELSTGNVTELLRLSGRLQWPKTPDTMGFTSDGRYLVYARGPAQVEVYNVDAGEVSALVDVGVQIKCLAVGPTDRHVAVGCEDDAIRVYEWGTKKPVKELRGHRDDVTSVAFSRDGKVMVSSALEIKVWSVK